MALPVTPFTLVFLLNLSVESGRGNILEGHLWHNTYDKLHG